MSGNGDALVVGAPARSFGGLTGRVSVYRRDSNVGGMGNYTQVGQDILGRENGDEFGYSVSMSDDGNTFVVGAPFSSPNNIYYAGSVYVYKMDSSVGGMGNYIQVGSDIVGTKIGDSIGFSVSMSGDGNTFVVGAPRSYMAAGSVSVYKLDSSVSGMGNYIKVGPDIVGKEGDGSSGDEFGTSVSMSGDATSFVVGAPNGNSFTGYVGVYKSFGGMSTYTQVGPDIPGKENDFFGSSVSISGNGDAFVVGSLGSNNFRGGVRVYKMDSSVGGMGNYSQFGPDVYDAARVEFGQSVSVKIPVKLPTKAPTTKAPSPKATTTSPTTTTPTASPENCGFLGWNLFCPQRGECGFWKRLLNLGNCD